MSVVMKAPVESLMIERDELLRRAAAEHLDMAEHKQSDLNLRPEDVRLLRRISKLNFLLGDDD